MTRRKVAVALNSSSFFSFVDCRALSWTSKMRKKKKREVASSFAKSAENRTRHRVVILNALPRRGEDGRPLVL